MLEMYFSPFSQCPYCRSPISKDLYVTLLRRSSDVADITTYHFISLFDASSFEPSDEELGRSGDKGSSFNEDYDSDSDLDIPNYKGKGKAPAHGSGRKKGKSAFGEWSHDEKAAFTRMKFKPSSKMKWMMEKLKEWNRDYPDDKVMIISQWTSCLDLVANYMDENQMKHLR